MELTSVYRFIVGIDVSKKTLDIYLLDRKTGRGKQTQVPNSKQGFYQLNQWLLKGQVNKSQAFM